MAANDDCAAYTLFAYCGNCPVDRYDNSGLLWKKIWNGLKKSARKVLNKTNKIMVSIGIDTAAIGAYILNMKKDKYGVYHANFDCWQQYFGYNDFYDFMFDIGTSMQSKNFIFNSKGKKYVLWAWKGDYINLGAGAELGIYYGGGFHWLVDKKLAMNMSMSLKYRGATIISYSANTWWLTGFNPKYLSVKASDLKVSFTVKFNKTKMFSDFRKATTSWSFDTRKNTANFTF